MPDHKWSLEMHSKARCELTSLRAVHLGSDHPGCILMSGVDSAPDAHNE